MRIFSKTISTLSKAILALLFVFLSTDGIAQDNNVWVIDGSGVGFVLDFNSEPPTLKGLQDVRWQRSSRQRKFNKVTVLDDAGRLKYYTRENNRDFSIEVYDANENLLFKNEIPSDSSYYYISTYIYEHNDTLTLLSQVTDWSYTYIIRRDYEISKGYRRTSNRVNGYEVSIPKEYYDTLFSNLVFSEVQGEIFILYSIGKDLVYAKLLNNNELKTVHIYNIAAQFSSLYSFSTAAAIPDFSYNSAHTKVQFRHPTFEYLGKTLFGNPRDYKVVEFNHSDGFSNLTEVYINRDKFKVKEEFYQQVESFTSVVASPNDIYSYLLITTNIYGKYQLVKFKYGIEIERMNLSKWYNDMRLGPNGKIYVFPVYIDKSEGQKGYVGVIENPDEDGPIKFTEPPEYYLNPISDKYSRSFGVFVIPTYDKPHKVVKFEADTLCSGLYAGFRNLTDSSHFERYRFYFGDGDSAEIDDDNKLLLAGIDNIPNEDAWGVRHRYTKAGTYLVKLRVFNAVGGWVWYSHEVVVVESSIPKFSVADTIGCEWIAYQIQDLSKVVNKGKDIMYHWTFGDGTDSNELNPRTNTKLENPVKVNHPFRVKVSRVKQMIKIDSI